jgi:hypothetical protein
MRGCDILSLVASHTAEDIHDMLVKTDGTAEQERLQKKKQ